MKKLISVLSIAGLLFMTVVGHAAENPKVIRIGLVGNAYGKPYTGGPQGYVNEHGLLEKEFAKDGIRIELSYFKGAGPAVNEALASGLADFGSVGDLVVIVGKAGGLKTKYILSSSPGGNTYIQVNPDAGIKTLKDLRGKKIGVNKGTYIHLALVRILESVGLTEKDVRLINLNAGDANAALATKSVDAIASSPDRPLVDQGIAKLLFDTRKSPAFQSGPGGLLVSEDFAKKYPDITKRVVKVLLRGYYWASQEKNREQLLALGLKAGTSYKNSKEDILGQDLYKKYDPRITAGTARFYKETIDYAFNHGIIRKKFNVEDLLDKSYSEAALKELGIENYWK
ncbi:MAG: ABC transporter substrate-binding protein [Chlorobium sp.]